MKTYKLIGLILALIGTAVLVLTATLDRKVFDDVPTCNESKELETLVENIDDHCKFTNTELFPTHDLVYTLESEDYITMDAIQCPLMSHNN